MPRLIDLISASALAIAACSTHPAQGNGGPSGPTGPSDPSDDGSQTMSKPTSPQPPSAPPKTTLEQVQRWAPPGSRVSPTELKVTGVELFAVRDDHPVPADAYSGGTLVGVVGGLGGKIVERDELVRAVIAARPDARTLAQVALSVARREGEILDAPKNDEQRKAKVAAPTITGGELVFWVWTSGVGRMLQLARLDLSTGSLDLGAPPPAAGASDDAVAQAITTLASPSVTQHGAALKTLAGACSTPKAKQALLDALAKHPRDETRRLAALESRACGASAVDPLLHALEHDKSADVQAQAVTTLGDLGDVRARPALEKAAKSDDYGLAMIAKDALKKLK
jgi:hypothetical protein